MSLADSLGGLETRDRVERVGYALDWGNCEVCGAVGSAPVTFNGCGGRGHHGQHFGYDQSAYSFSAVAA